jgi:prepilin-type N-terminal cleavage/methylation domain-containing protein
MKLQSAFPGPCLSAPASSQSAFTLPEMLIASTLFLLLVAGVVGANLFGLRMSQLTQTKLNTSAAARQTVGRMADEIRNCKSTYVGYVSNGVFVALLHGETQTGSGLLIYPTTNTANFILYFLNSSDQSFRRTTSAAGSTTVLARGVTNTVVFRAQDYLGNILTNSDNNRVIHFDIEFFQAQPQLPTADYYKLETSVTKRALL